jgi:hypothetical protein
MAKDFPQTKEAKGFTQVHSTFQSTSSCNITTVNAMNDTNLYVKQKERDRGPSKRLWGIEMNSSRGLYLKTYGAIDKMDHMINNCDMHYRSCKYWYSAMLHDKSMTIVTAYDMYKECAEGNLDLSWKVPIEDFHTFREKLSEQMLQYDPHHRLYHGDENLLDCNQQNKKAQHKSVKTGKGLVVKPVEKGG